MLTRMTVALVLTTTLMTSSIPMPSSFEQAKGLIVENDEQEVIKFKNTEERVKEFKLEVARKTEENRLKKEEEERKKEIAKKQEYYDTICYYNPNNLSEPSNISVEKAYELLKGTTYQTLECATSFVESERLKPSVNAIFLISMTKKESLHGKSGLAQIKNNISSWRVSRGGWKSFDSKAQCISQTAQLLSTEYLQPSGQYWYNGVDISSINHYYCEGNDWEKEINEIANEIRRK